MTATVVGLTPSTSVETVLDAYVALYERHVPIAPRPAAASRLFRHWLPILAGLQLDVWDTASLRSISELAEMIHAIEDPRLQLTWLDQFPAAIASQAISSAPEYGAVSFDWSADFDPQAILEDELWTLAEAEVMSVSALELLAA